MGETATVLAGPAGLLNSQVPEIFVSKKNRVSLAHVPTHTAISPSSRSRGAGKSLAGGLGAHQGALLGLNQAADFNYLGLEKSPEAPYGLGLCSHVHINIITLPKAIRVTGGSVTGWLPAVHSHRSDD